MKNLVILIVIILGGSFATKLYLENAYETSLDEELQKIRPFVNISYDDVIIGWDSSISINGIQVTSSVFKEAIDIEQIMFNTSDPLFPIKGHEIFENGKYPELLEMRLDGVQMNTGFIEKLYKDQQCREFAYSMNYDSAGYERMNYSMSASVDFGDPTFASFRMDGFDQTAEWAMGMTFDATKTYRDTIENDEVAVNEVWLEMELTPEAGEAFSEQCAKVFKVDADTYLNKVVGSPKYSQKSFGADLGPDFRKALIAFMRGDSDLRVTSRPSKQLKRLSQAKFFKAHDVVRWLDLDISQEGNPITLDAKALAVGQTVAERKAKAAKLAEPKFVEIPVSQADKYINKRVRIKRTKGRSEVVGRLMGVKRGRFEVKRFLATGPMTLTVGPKDVQVFEVLQ